MSAGPLHVPPLPRALTGSMGSVAGSPWWPGRGAGVGSRAGGTGGDQHATGAQSSWAALPQSTAGGGWAPGCQGPGCHRLRLRVPFGYNDISSRPEASTNLTQGVKSCVMQTLRPVAGWLPSEASKGGSELAASWADSALSKAGAMVCPTLQRGPRPGTRNRTPCPSGRRQSSRTAGTGRGQGRVAV